jgi:CheY-like chemotaxis protein
MQEKGGVLTIAIRDVILGEGDPGGGREDGHSVEIEVTDTGSGIAPDIIDRVYEPYFTTKGLGTGTGMGLAVVHGIVESYGGRIALESQLGQGTVVRIHLPVIKDRSESLVLKQAESPAPGRGHILFVDDEEMIANLNKRVLKHMGYEVTAYTDSIKALDDFRLRSHDFDLVITDMTMPGMTGEELAMAVMKERQDIPVILCSGYSDTMKLQQAKDIGIKAFLSKPVERADLARTLREVLAG